MIDIHDRDFQTFVVHNLSVLQLADFMRAYDIYVKEGIRPITEEEIEVMRQALDKL